MNEKSEPEILPELDKQKYLKDGNLEAHMIIDMLRIENITAELREFKETVNARLTKSEELMTKRLDKLENWIIGIVGASFTTLAVAVINMLGG